MLFSPFDGVGIKDSRKSGFAIVPYDVKECNRVENYFFNSEHDKPRGKYSPFAPKEPAQFEKKHKGIRLAIVSPLPCTVTMLFTLTVSRCDCIRMLWIVVSLKSSNAPKPMTMVLECIILRYSS